MEFKTKEERDKFILDNTRLVDWVIKHKVKVYNPYALPKEDLRQLGYIGLIKAVDRFDESKGVKFSSYATLIIYGEIASAFRDVNNGIFYGRKILANKTKVEDMRNIEKKSYKEIAKELNLKEKDVIEINCIDLKSYSLNSRAIVREKELDNIEYLDMLTYEDESYNEELEYLLDILTERNKKILVEYFICGISQTEISKEYGLSQMQVSRIIKKSLEKMRKAC